LRVEKFSEKFSTEMGFCKIDPWVTTLATPDMGETMTDCAKQTRHAVELPESWRLSELSRGWFQWSCV
jgi:hypothetical protein